MIDDWTTFLLVGATALPGFMVATNAETLPLAALVFVVLLFSAVFASLLDEASPARKAAAAKHQAETTRRDIEHDD